MNKNIKNIGIVFFVILLNIFAFDQVKLLSSSSFFYNTDLSTLSLYFFGLIGYILYILINYRIILDITTPIKDREKKHVKFKILALSYMGFIIIMPFIAYLYLFSSIITILVFQLIWFYSLIENKKYRIRGSFFSEIFLVLSITFNTLIINLALDRTIIEGSLIIIAEAAAIGLVIRFLPNNNFTIYKKRVNSLKNISLTLLFMACSIYMINISFLKMTNETFQTQNYDINNCESKSIVYNFPFGYKTLECEKDKQSVIKKGDYWVYSSAMLSNKKENGNDQKIELTKKFYDENSKYENKNIIESVFVNEYADTNLERSMYNFYKELDFKIIKLYEEGDYKGIEKLKLDAKNQIKNFSDFISANQNSDYVNSDEFRKEYRKYLSSRSLLLTNLNF